MKHKLSFYGRLPDGKLYRCSVCDGRFSLSDKTMEKIRLELGLAYYDVGDEFEYGDGCRGNLRKLKRMKWDRRAGLTG